jgi:hypothetical protein
VIKWPLNRTSSPGFTNLTPRKRKLSRGKHSSQTIIQGLDALESLSLEEPLQDPGSYQNEEFYQWKW